MIRILQFFAAIAVMTTTCAAYGGGKRPEALLYHSHMLHIGMNFLLFRQQLVNLKKIFYNKTLKGRILF